MDINLESYYWRWRLMDLFSPLSASLGDVSKIPWAGLLGVLTWKENVLVNVGILEHPVRVLRSSFSGLFSSTPNFVRPSSDIIIKGLKRTPGMFICFWPILLSCVGLRPSPLPLSFLYLVF